MEKGRTKEGWSGKKKQRKEEKEGMDSLKKGMLGREAMVEAMKQ